MEGWPHTKPAPSGGHTTVIRRILERCAERPPVADETTASVAIMLRTVPPPKALLVILDPALRQHFEAQITCDLLDLESVADEQEAQLRCARDFRSVVITDNLEMVRRLRATARQRAPFILYVTELDEAAQREEGLSAGADDCIGRRASPRELDARLGTARRIAELESVLRITVAENHKLSAIDDLTRVASRRFFRKHFPREIARAARYGRALSLILCDIDHFRGINETLGHAGGDQVLQQFGPCLQQSLRANIDWVARIGGED